MQKRKLQIIAAVILFLGLGQTAVAQTAVPVEKNQGIDSNLRINTSDCLTF